MVIRCLHIGFGNFARGFWCDFLKRWLMLDPHLDLSLETVSLTNKQPINATNSSVPHFYVWQPTQHLKSRATHIDFPITAIPASCLTGANESIRLDLISITATEKAYPSLLAQPLNGKPPPVARDDETQHSNDLAHYLSRVLHAQWSRHQHLPKILSLDNVGRNGDRLAQQILWEADRLSKTFAKQLHAKLVCPNTVVDRIVPAPTSEDREEFLHATGIKTDAVIKTEAFFQLSIESSAQLWPARWPELGVDFVNDIDRPKSLKLRILNAAHSMLAYRGLRMGLKYVHEAIANHELRAAADMFIEQEVLPSLAAPLQNQALEYWRTTISRFQNSSLPHRLEQIAQDGSVKVMERWHPTLVTRVSWPIHSALIQNFEAWFEYVTLRLQSNDEWADPLRLTIDPNQPRSWLIEHLGLNDYFK